MKAKIAESEGRLMCSKCQSEMLPNREGVYEFENFRPGMASRPSTYADNPVEQPVKMAADATTRKTEREKKMQGNRARSGRG